MPVLCVCKSFFIAFSPTHLSVQILLNIQVQVGRFGNNGEDGNGRKDSERERTINLNSGLQNGVMVSLSRHITKGDAFQKNDDLEVAEIGTRQER